MFSNIGFILKIASKVEAGIMAFEDKIQAPQDLRAGIVKQLNTFKRSKIENENE